MPLSSVLYAFTGGIISSVSKLLVDYLLATECYLKLIVRHNMDSNFPAITDSHIIPYNKHFFDRIVSKVTGNNFGIFVCTAPKDFGKSTLVKMLIREIYNSTKNVFKFKYIVNGDHVLRDRNLQLRLNIPEDRSLSEFLPKNSIIVVDSIYEDKNISEDFRLYLNELANDSYQSKYFKIIFCVSCASHARKIMAIDSKIRELCSPIELQWSQEQALEFLNQFDKFQTMISAHKDLILDYGRRIKFCPGLLRAAMNSDEIDSDETIHLFDKIIADTQKYWNDYENMDSLEQNI